MATTLPPAKADARIDRFENQIRELDSLRKRLSRTRTQVERNHRQLLLINLRIQKISEECQPFWDQYEKSPWNRYYLVPDGKIHTSKRCRACNHYENATGGYSSTLFTLLTEWSGKSHTDMVKAYGHDLCSHCCPDVVNHPAYTTKGVMGDLAEQERARKAAEKARKADTKAATIPRDDDGNLLRLTDGCAPTTQRSAQNKVAELLNLAWWNRALAQADGTPAHVKDTVWMGDAALCARAAARLAFPDNPALQAEAAGLMFEEAQKKAQKVAAARLRRRDTPK